MNETQNTSSDLETICQQQYELIERNKVQIWDLEEEARVLRDKTVALQTVIDKQLGRINELEAWCTHLQRCLDQEKDFSILYKVARRIKRLFIKK